MKKKYEVLFYIDKLSTKKDQNDLKWCFQQKN